MDVLGINLTCEQYETLCSHVQSCGADWWESLTTEEKRNEIKRLIA